MRLRRWLWRRPEAPVLGLSAVAWVLLLAPLGSVGMAGTSMSAGGSSARRLATARAGAMPMGAGAAPMRVAALPRSLQMTGVPGAVRLDRTSSAAGRGSMGWTLPMFVLMVVAMMLPSVTESVRLAAALSLWRRRGRAIAEWLAGYVGVWVLAGTAILGTRALATHNGLLHPGQMPLMVGLLAAAVWQLTPVKRLALNGCHRTWPLAPHGLRADRDCVLYGAMIARECVISCGPMMAAMTLGQRNQALVMVAMTMIVLAERYRRRMPRRTSAAALGLLAVAVV